MRTKIAGVITLIAIVALVFWSPFESKDGGFTDILRHWGTQQEELSEDITNKVVKPVEYKITGETEEHKSNWSIPNIIRNMFGIE